MPSIPDRISSPPERVRCIVRPSSWNTTLSMGLDWDGKTVVLGCCRRSFLLYEPIGTPFRKVLGTHYLRGHGVGTSLFVCTVYGYQQVWASFSAPCPTLAAADCEDHDGTLATTSRRPPAAKASRSAGWLVPGSNVASDASLLGWRVMDIPHPQP